jgi:hypothetical protein
VSVRIAGTRYVGQLVCGIEDQLIVDVPGLGPTYVAARHAEHLPDGDPELDQATAETIAAALAREPIRALCPACNGVGEGRWDGERLRPVPDGERALDFCGMCQGDGGDPDDDPEADAAIEENRREIREAKQ